MRWLISMTKLIVIATITTPTRYDNRAAQDSTRWLSTQHSSLVTATALMPSAGISFLWFIGVVRDGLGRFEDRFLASVFLGSGPLFLAMTFVAAPVVAGLVATNTGAIDSPARAGVIDLGRFVVLAATKTYAIRMAAVFMLSLATIWLRTGLMPRWLVAISYLVGVGLLIAGDRACGSRWPSPRGCW
ncbi:hypothetical protein A5686_01180 [Mycobacterium sp. E2479]|nr:hypothetical protein A5686_01180 [Mycobacterium sp. E2479]